MAAFHPKYNITIKEVSMKYARYWEQQGFVVTPDIKLKKKPNRA